MATLRDTPDWWMQVRCECTVSSIPVRLLIERHGPDADPAAIARRLICSHTCGQRPHSVVLIDDPRRSEGDSHYPTRVAPVVLVGAP